MSEEKKLFDEIINLLNKFIENKKISNNFEKTVIRIELLAHLLSSLLWTTSYRDYEEALEGLEIVNKIIKNNFIDLRNHKVFGENKK